MSVMFSHDLIHVCTVSNLLNAFNVQKVSIYGRNKNLISKVIFWNRLQSVFMWFLFT